MPPKTITTVDPESAELIERFVADRERGRGGARRSESPRYLDQQRRYLEVAVTVAGKPLLALEPEDIKEVQAVYATRGEGTKKWVDAALRAFFDWAEAQGLREGLNPMTAASPPMLSSTAVPPFPLERLGEMEDALVDAFGGDGADHRRVVFRTMAETGMRLEEVVRLKRKDVLDDGLVGDGGRFVPANPLLIAALRTHARKTPPKLSPYAIRSLTRVTPWDKPLAHQTFGQAFEVGVRALGLDPRVYTPSSLRQAFFARAAERVGQDTAYALVGHKGRFGTEMPRDELKAAYEKVWE